MILFNAIKEEYKELFKNYAILFHFISIYREKKYSKTNSATY